MRGSGARRLAGAGVIAGVAAVAAGATAIGRRPGRSKGSGGRRAADDHLIPFGESLTVPVDDGAELAVTVAGPADGPMAVLAHCWMGGREVWAPVAHRLIARGHRVVLYDQRGHGSSTSGSGGYTMDRLASDLRAVLEAVDARDAVLAGHSMGGMTIMALAGHDPAVVTERAAGIVLVSTAAYGVGGLRGRPPGAWRRARAARVVGSRALTLLWASRLGPAALRGIFGVETERDHVALSARLFSSCPPDVRSGFLTAMLEMDHREAISRISVPVTVMVGSRDRLTGRDRADEMVSGIAGARLVVLEGKGHMLPLEAAGDVADAVAAAVQPAAGSPAERQRAQARA